MRELPTGSVTMLFVDVESSTVVLERLGTATYAGALTKLRHAVRAAVSRHGGQEVDMQGDALFSVFVRAKDAVEAAIEAQRALAGSELQARMGLHTGTPTLIDEGYVGRDVHRAARICAAGAGGEVLLSEATRALLDYWFETTDLGERELKGLAKPERLHRLALGG